MEVRQLFLSDKKALDILLCEVESSLLHQEYWLPIDNISKQHFFDKEWTILYGAFINSHLVGVVGLFLNQHEYEESTKQLNLASEKVVELGRLMVHPKYRGKGISKILVTHAIKNCPDCNILLATVHPDNIPSKQALLSCGFTYEKTYTKSCGYVRDIVIQNVGMV